MAYNSFMKKIFIIDDDSDIREVMTYVLESEGYEPVLFSSAHEAYKILEQASDLPFAIILDYMMPGMNGLEFLNKMSELPAPARKIPVAFSSGLGSVEGINTDIKVTILSKPIDIEQLFQFLNSV